MENIATNRQKKKRPTAPPGEILISYPQTETKVDLDRTTIWRMIQRGDFPEPVKTSPGRVAFKLSAVEQWIEDRVTV